MISYNDFTDFDKTNYNFSLCDDWGWFHIDEEEENALKNAFNYMHYTVPQIQPYKSILKKRCNPFTQNALNITQKMPHVRITIDNVYKSVSPPSPYNSCTLGSSFGTIRNGLIFGVILMIYMLSP